MHFEHYLRFLTDQSWQDPRLHFHDRYEILFSLTDAGKIFVHDEIFLLNKGALFYFTPGELHRVLCDVTEFERYVLHIPEEFFSQFVKVEGIRFAFPEPFGYTLVQEDSFSTLKQLFDRLYQLENNDPKADSLLITITFLELIFQLLMLSSATQKGGSAIPNNQLNRIRPIIDYLQAHITEQISLNELAERFYMSKYYISHLFKEATNFTISEYVVKNRLSMARRLLRDGKSVQETCELCGFQNYTHFIRSFTKDIGVSPGRYARTYEEYHKI